MRTTTITFLLLCCVSATASTSAPGPGAGIHAVGFDVVSIAADTGPPITAGVWYPTLASPAPEPLGGWTQVVARAAAVAPGRHPIIVMSHGSGGWFGGHYDTALALAEAGFIVAALTHPGDNFQDQSRATDMGGRVRALDTLVDYMVGGWSWQASVDTRRIGAFGFSAGGFTALVAGGGEPDFSTLTQHCDDRPHADDCSIIRSTGLSLQHLIDSLSGSVAQRTPRIRALAVAAPALGFTFLPDGLHGVTIPVQLWRAERDSILRFPDYADAVRRALPAPPEYHVVPDAGHFDFLAPCDATLAERNPGICASGARFDRAAFHERFNAEMVAFFCRTLGCLEPEQPIPHAPEHRGYVLGLIGSGAD